MARDWEFYLCEVDGKAASINLDLGLYDQAPIEDLPIRVVFRLHLRDPREDGLSSQEEFPRLSEIEDVLFQAADEAETPVVFVGRVTFGGCRDFIFYAADEMSPRTLLSTAMTAFPEYQFEVEGSEEPDWATYLSFLYPSDRDMQVIQNRRVLETLATHGDLHDQPREVCHWITFTTVEDRAVFQAAMEAQGFLAVNTQNDDTRERPFGLTLARVDSVDYHSINRVVLFLFDAALECRGDYDGWETQVVKAAP